MKNNPCNTIVISVRQWTAEHLLKFYFLLSVTTKQSCPLTGISTGQAERRCCMIPQCCSWLICPDCPNQILLVLLCVFRRFFLASLLLCIFTQQSCFHFLIFTHKKSERGCKNHSKITSRMCVTLLLRWDHIEITLVKLLISFNSMSLLFEYEICYWWDIQP